MTATLVRNRLIDLVALPSELQHLARAAVEAQGAAYAPYSRFGVGAALLHSDNVITTGCNYENCTYQACCAERCAIVRANVEGRRQATAVAVYGGPVQMHGVAPAVAVDPDALCYPCGLCRQLLLEVAQLSSNYDTFDVICVTHSARQVRIVRLADLLPNAFGPADVGVNVRDMATSLT